MIVREGKVARCLPHLTAGVDLVFAGQLRRHDPPHPLLVVGVVDVRCGGAGGVVERERGDGVAARAVVLVVHAGVVIAQVHCHVAVTLARHRRVELGLGEHDSRQAPHSRRDNNHADNCANCTVAGFVAVGFRR